MKKIFGISLVAILAVTPLMASAAVGDVVSSGTTPKTMESQPASAAAAVTAGVAASGDPYYSLATEGSNDDVAASAGYVKGAYNAAIKAVNKVHGEAVAAQSTATTALETAQSITNTALISTGDGLKKNSTDPRKVEVNLSTTNAGLKVEGDTAGSKTLNVKAGDGVKLDSTGVAVDFKSDSGLALYGENAGSKKLYVKTGTGLETTSSGVGIKSGGVDTTQLANQAVTADKIKNNTITTGQMATTAIATSIGSTTNAVDTKLATEKAVATAISGMATTGYVDGKTNDKATKEGVAATVNKATATSSNTSLSVNFGTISTNTSSLTVAVPTKANYKIMKTWGSDNATDATYALGTNTNQSVSGTAITTIGASTATGTVSSTVSVPGYYENASDTTAETFTTQG